MIKRVSVLLCVVLISSCFLRESTDVDTLNSRIESYYAFEKNRDWNATYQFRSDGFKSAIKLETYRDRMAADTVDWEMLDYQILDVSVRDKKAVVSMSFTERLPEALRQGEIDVVTTEEETLWLNVDGTWRCFNAGTRGHIALNTAVTLD